MAERTFRDGVRAMAPLVVAVVAFAVSFGVLARAAGFGWFAPIVMSATTFAGSAQFASVSVLTPARAVPAPTRDASTTAASTSSLPLPQYIQPDSSRCLAL